MTRPLCIFLLSLLSLAAVQETAAQESLSGRASVVDGDTIEIHGTRIRLRRVDAPEAAQLCEDQEGKSWRCGQQAALALDQFIGRRVVHCNELGKGKYRRTLASCRVGRTDLGAWLVSEGWAIAYLDRKGLYREAQDQAEANKRGIRSGRFERPSEWRKNRKRRSGAS
ncbi:thermonuclease family protein [Paracoccus cavernae]|uniref:Thermonuclease family protein n=1 Tax=Paracoccus cavernae TaxID=1571207 RepID=A0ABT8DDQ6_9RHOB|nr:thermonuclease family protein [Paracoccus cavernae]